MFASEKQQGFTLIEIIVALVVISVALGAVISTTGSSVSYGSHLKEKTIALWVAKNHISEISMTRQWPSTGQQSDEALMAGHKWFITNKVTQTPDKNIRRMDLSIYADRLRTDQLVTLVAYISQPLLFNGGKGKVSKGKPGNDNNDVNKNNDDKPEK